MNQLEHRLIPKKLVVGISFYERLNSVINIWGVITDEIMSKRGTNGIAADYFTHVATLPDGSGAVINNPEKQKELRVSVGDVTFASGLYYEHDAALSFSSAFDDAKFLIKSVFNLLPYYSVKRIGIVGEYRAFISDNPRDYLFRVSNLTAPVNPFGFILTYQSRRYEDSANPPKNLEASNFKNILFSYYDSAVDQCPDSGGINANIDVQENFFPPVTEDIVPVLSKHYKYFDSEAKKFKANAKQYGLSGTD